MLESRFYAVAHSPSLLTDLYQLTMALGYWKTGTQNRRASFYLHFRNCPFGGQFAVACGTSAARDWLAGFRFTPQDREYLASLRHASGGPLFENAFLELLGSLRLTCTISAVPEGTVVFPHEPLLRVEGPILQCQLLETALLTFVGFETLIATKAARMRLVAGDDRILEFGLRRAQGTDGGLSASRAAFIGGCDSTSNVLAGKEFGIPVAGTHAHSWVMAFETEQQAFDAYAASQPHNCLLLVDTYDTLQGVHRAVKVGKRLREQGAQLLGIRLDSGDLLRLSQQARQILDENGLNDAQVVASGDLDEYEIHRLKSQGACIDIWGIGTKLATAFDQPALGGVYKLSAVQEADHPDAPWQPRVKRSDTPAKSSLPGRLLVLRGVSQDRFVGDVVADVSDPSPWPRAAEPAADQDVVSPTDGTACPIESVERIEELLVPLMEDGEVVSPWPSAQQARERLQEQLQALPAEVTCLEDPRSYPVGLTRSLWALRRQILARMSHSDEADE